MKINTEHIKGLISGEYAIEHTRIGIDINRLNTVLKSTFNITDIDCPAYGNNMYYYKTPSDIKTDNLWWSGDELPAGMEAKPLSFFFDEDEAFNIDTAIKPIVAANSLFDECQTAEQILGMQPYIQTYSNNVVEPMEREKPSIITKIANDAEYTAYVFEPKNRAKIELLRDILQWCKNNEIKDKWNLIPIMFSISENPKHPMIAQFNPKSLTAYELFKDRLHLLID